MIIPCWSDPGDVPESATLLSFLPPAEDAALRRRHGRVVSAAEASRVIRPAAQKLYVELVAKAGAILQHEIGPRWWYHPVSFRDCESDPAYNDLIAMLTVRELGGEVTHPRHPHRKAVARALASRGKMVIAAMQHAKVSRSIANDRHFDVALSAFWDWSLTPETDRYYKALPEALRGRGATVGYVAWLSGDVEPGKADRSFAETIAPLHERDDVALLQRELKPSDIMNAYRDFTPLRKYIKVKRAVADAMGEYFPLFESSLMRGFAGSTIPNCELVELATYRALQRHTPARFVTFLEHFPHSRAQYAAAKKANVKTINVMHASYCHEKTFLVLDPVREAACPRPDVVCTIGELAKGLFLESGYGEDAVRVTGSPRYDHVSALLPAARGEGGRRPGEGPRRVLIAASLAVEPELELLEAIAAAAEGLENIELVLRNHPFQRMHEQPRFEPLRDRIRVSSASLDEDLANADVVLFSYSTVAEEAFLKGKAVWQWLPRGFNGSALAEVWPIPQFSTIGALRDALQRDVETPHDEAKAHVSRALFGPCDGNAAQRVATEILR